MAVLAFLSSDGALEESGRLAIDFESEVGDRGNVTVHCLASNCALIESRIVLTIAQQVEFKFIEPEVGTVVWTSGRLAICLFDKPVSCATLALENLSAAIGPELIFGTPRVEDIQYGAMDGSFGVRLHRLRTEKGLKQADIAEKFGISVAAVSGWESGKAFPRGSRWAELADYLGVRLAELVGDDTDDLSRLVAASRVDIARLARTTPDKIRISVDL